MAYESFHAGTELDDEAAEEKRRYNSFILDLLGESSGASNRYWDGNQHVERLKSHRTGSVWEVRSEPAYPGLMPVSAKRIMANGPNRSEALRRAYKLLGERYNLPDQKYVTGRAYITRCEHQIPVLPAHPFNHAHLAGAAGLVLRQILRTPGPHNAAFVTHLLDAVPLDHVSGWPVGPLQYRQASMRALAQALQGFVFLVVGFDETVVRTYNPVMKGRKSTQFVDDHIAEKEAYHAIPDLGRTRWWVPHQHFIVLAFDPSGRVVSYNRLRQLLDPMRTYRHALQVQPLVGGRGYKAAACSFASTVLDYSNKRLSELNDVCFRYLMEHHLLAPVSGIFDALVDATNSARLSPVIHEFSDARDAMHRIVKTDRLHKPGLATLEDHLDWFEGRTALSYQ